MRGAWIEIGIVGTNNGRAASLPVRGAWIEMCIRSRYVSLAMGKVAPRAGVDENVVNHADALQVVVAPCAGSVD